MKSKFPLIVRGSFEALPQEASHQATRAPRWAEIFTPNDHQGALDPHRAVVVGDRGTGKSFWSSVLVDPKISALVAKRYPRIGLSRVFGRLGFSDAEMKADHPSPAEISAIMDSGHRAEDLWRAVLLRFAPFPPKGIPKKGGWQETVDWVAKDPGRRNAEFRVLDADLMAAGKIYVLVLDALDVIADDWNAIRARLEGVIKLALAVRALEAIRVKIFIRPDMADDRKLWGVGDASKLRHNEVQLVWKRRDLYGLLWTLLANPQEKNAQLAAKTFRTHCATDLGVKFEQQDDSWRPLQAAVDDEDSQKEVFRSLAGDYMGAGPSKGDTYKWVPNHLANAAGFAAPRSFLLAMKEAAEKTKSQDTVLDKSGIEAGVRIASRIRVQELYEDYRWMDKVLEAMEGLIVPLRIEDLIDRLKERGTLAELTGLAESKEQRFIPPGDVLEAPDENEAYLRLIEVLKRLKIFFTLSDGRINMPDLFRLQANVKRKGGMKPRA